MDFVKAETDADNETCMVSADIDNDMIDIKDEMVPALITFPVLKSEWQVSCADITE
jgi:hypothetical protein